MSETNEKVTAATDALRETVAALEAEETRLTTELATVKAKRKAVANALNALDDTKPKRRRGRPPKNASATPAEPAAA